MRAALLALLIGAALAWFAHGLRDDVEGLRESQARFEHADERLESMLPKDRGLAPEPTFPEDFLKVRIRVSRRNHASEAHAYTHVAIDDGPSFALPKGWRGRARESQDRIAAHDAVTNAIRQVIRERITAAGFPPADVKGEIVAADPQAGAVPHGDVVSMLNVLLTLGIVDIVFDGPATPLTEAERAARRAGPPRDAQAKDDR